jgi:hypothetical protein
MPSRNRCHSQEPMTVKHWSALISLRSSKGPCPPGHLVVTRGHVHAQSMHRLAAKRAGQGRGDGGRSPADFELERDRAEHLVA